MAFLWLRSPELGWLEKGVKKNEWVLEAHRGEEIKMLFVCFAIQMTRLELKRHEYAWAECVNGGFACHWKCDPQSSPLSQFKIGLSPRAQAVANPAAFDATSSQLELLRSCFLFPFRITTMRTVVCGGPHALSLGQAVGIREIVNLWGKNVRTKKSCLFMRVKS